MERVAWYTVVANVPARQKKKGFATVAFNLRRAIILVRGGSEPNQVHTLERGGSTPPSAFMTKLPKSLKLTRLFQYDWERLVLRCEQRDGRNIVVYIHSTATFTPTQKQAKKITQWWLALAKFNIQELHFR